MGIFSLKLGLMAGDTEVKLQKVEPFAFCSLKHKGPFSDMGQVVNQLMNMMHGQNITPAGPLFSLFHAFPEAETPEVAEWEVGFPVTAQVLVQPPLVKKQWQYSLVAVLLHTGPFGETGHTVDKIMEWLETEGYVSEGPVLGKYLDIPMGESIPSNPRIEIWVPCRNK